MDRRDEIGKEGDSTFVFGLRTDACSESFRSWTMVG